MRYFIFILLAACGLPLGEPSKYPPYNFKLTEGTSIAFADVSMAVNQAMGFEFLKEGTERLVTIELNTKEVLEFQKTTPGAVANYADDHIYIHAGIVEDPIIIFDNLMMHEIGHSMGLGHNATDPTSIMFKIVPVYSPLDDSAKSLKKELCDQFNYRCN